MAPRTPLGSATWAELIYAMPLMTRLRWRAFKAISALGWMICPEPMRSDLLARINVQWNVYAPDRPTSGDTHAH